MPDTMPELLNTSTALRARLTALAACAPDGVPVAEYEAALVECKFRLAVQPETPLAEAFELLLEAERRDATDPKHAYHLGRLCFLCGELDLAATWWLRARRLAPGNHRLWSHVALLHFEFLERCEGRPEVKSVVLRRRSQALLDAVRAGSREAAEYLFDSAPPRSDAPDEAAAPNSSVAETASVEAVADKRTACGWSGAHDLVIESWLAPEPHQDLLERIVPVLTQSANEALRSAERRPRFVILAIQTLIAGYGLPVVRKLRDSFEDCTLGPDLLLLDRVMAMFATGVDVLAAQLSEEIQQNRLPTTLAALIHRQRLLGSPLTISATRVHRAATLLLEERVADPDRAGKFARLLEDALAEFERAPPEPVGSDLDAPTADAVPQDIPQRLANAEAATTVLEQLCESTWRHLRDEVKKPTESVIAGVSLGRVAADAQLLTRTVDALKPVIAHGLAEANAIKAALGRQTCGSADPAVGKRLESCLARIQNLSGLGKFHRALLAVGRFLAAHGALPEAVPPSDTAMALCNRAESLAQSAGAANRLSGSSPNPTARIVGTWEPIPRLRHAHSAVESAVDLRFESAATDLAAYPPCVSLHPAFSALRTAVAARHAEALYRLGRVEDAVGVWHGMRCEDPFDRSAARNIAVANTNHGDMAKALDAWRDHVQLLYFHDVAAGDPRPLAGERAKLHRAFAHAYLPRFMLQDLNPAWQQSVDWLDLLAFLSSPRRVGNFVDHKQLEFLNLRLQFTSPPLVLGVARSDGAGVRQQALTMNEAYLNRIGPLLPARIRRPFLTLVRERLRAADIDCASRLPLTSRASQAYDEQRVRLLEVFTGIAHLKFKFALAILSRPELPRQLRSVGFLRELARLDDLPLGPSQEHLQRVAGGLGRAPREIEEFMGDAFTESLVKKVLEFVLDQCGEQAEDNLRMRQYQHLVEDWVQDPALKAVLPLIDNLPGEAYPEPVRGALAGVAESGPALRILYVWCERYPELTGPARFAADLLSRDRQFEAAARVLSGAIASAFYPPGARACRIRRAVAWQHLGLELHQSGNPEGGWQWLRQARDEARRLLNSGTTADEARELQRLLENIPA